MQWKPYSGMYQAGTRGYVSKIPAAEIFYDGLRSKDDPKSHKAVILLPGFKKPTANFISKEEAKTWCETMLEKWLDAAGLTVKL